MSHLESTLERLGPPPPEVCLDWAWQLVELIPVHSSVPANLPNGTRPAQLAWSDVDCDRQGVLRLAAQPTSEAWAVDDLLRDVYSWAGPGNGLETSENFARVPTSPDSSHSSAAVFPNSLPPKGLSRTGPSVRNGGTGRNGKNGQPPNRTRSAHQSTRLRQTKRTASAPVFWRRWVCLAASALGLCGCLFVYAWYPLASDSQPSESPSIPVQQAVAASVPEQSPAGGVHAGHEMPVQVARLAPGDQRESSPGVPLAVNRSDSEPPWTELGGFIPAGAHAGAEPGNSPAEPPTSLDETAHSKDTQISMPPTISSEELLNVEIDLPGTVREMTRGAAAVISEAEMSADDAAQDSSYNLPIHPMVQNWKVPSSPRLRVLEPTWRLRLQVGCEGFAVEPTGWQTLAPKSVTSWSLSGTVKEFAAFPRVAVQVRQLGSRGPSLQWYIAAMSENTPPLILPLAPERLQPIARQLAHLQQRLQSSLGELEGLLAAAGVPSNVQSSLRAKRKDLQAQRDLASEMVRFVALVQQLATQLDGSLEVDAEYFDGAVTDGPALLTLGRGPASGFESPSSSTNPQRE